MRKNDDTLEYSFANSAVRYWPFPMIQTIVRVCFCDTSIQMGLSCLFAVVGRVQILLYAYS